MRIFLGILNLVAFSSLCIYAIEVPGLGNINVNGDGVQLETTDNNIPSGNPACANCTKYINEQAAGALKYLAVSEPSSIPDVEPCYNFGYEGWNSAVPVGDACVERDQSNPNFILTTIYIRVGYVKFFCGCSLQPNQSPIEVFNAIRTVLGNLTDKPVPQCGVNDVTQLVEGEVAGSSFSIFHPETYLATATRCTAYQSNPSPVPTHFNLTAEVVNVTIKAIVQRDTTIKGTKGFSIKDVVAVEQSFKDSAIHCDSDGSADVCDCVVDSKLSAATLQELVLTYLTCYAQAGDQYLQFVAATYGDCSDFLK